VKQIIELHGKEDFEIEIRRVFDNRESAINWEMRVNRWTMRWPNYLNKHSNGNWLITGEEKREISIRAGIKCRDLKIGFHKLTLADRKENSKKAGETNKRNKTGVCGISLEKRIENGLRCKEQGIGFHSVESREKQKKSAKKPWWNNGIEDIKSDACPGPGWTEGRVTKGRVWWNNGINSIMSVVPPDSDNWVKGRLNWRK